MFSMVCDKTVVLQPNTCEMDKELEGTGLELPIVEEFYTLQGEGFHTGKAAYFIRVGGCDVCCSWCDVKVSWNPDIHALGRVEDIVAKATEYPAKAVVVTGGEPALYNLAPLTDALHAKGFQTFIETSGSSPLTGSWDWICLSPKKNKAPLTEFLCVANELKVVIDNKLDFAWAEMFKSQVSENCKLYLQPEWSVYRAVIPEIVNYIKSHPEWNASLQAHKFMHIP